MIGFSSPEELNVPGVVKETFVDADLHHSLRDRLERDGSYANVEFQLRTRDHRVITVRENARVVRDENGNVLYYEGTLTDITERIRFEKQLREAQKMEALGRLAGGIARDFRGIGAGMVAGLHRALGGLPEDSPARPHLDAVARSMASADALTRQILDFSRSQLKERQVKETGDPGKDGVAIDLNTLIVEMGPVLCHLVGPDIPLDLSLCEMSAPVLADRDHIRQIVTRFVIHARGFGAGATKIFLTTAIEMTGPAGGPAVCLSVAANAAASATDVQTDADNEAAEARAWIGMGTSRAILAQYGGTMTAAVEPPVVRYTMYLPLASAAHPAPPVQDSLPGFATVLLVEEEPLVRELSRDMLERQGFRVLTAGNTAEAERVARGQQAFDALITTWTQSSPESGGHAGGDRQRSGDIGGQRGGDSGGQRSGNSGGEGAALARTLREMRPDLRVLFVTGYSDAPPDALPVPDASATLQKPFSGDSLGRSIRQLLDRSRPTA
jgi:two-component system cell cycle sensor histidine kinase/response regulator CckA